MYLTLTSTDKLHYNPVSKATSYIIPLLVVAFALYNWGDDKQHTATDAIATSEQIKQNMSLDAVRTKALEKLQSNSPGFSELVEAAATLQKIQDIETPEAKLQETSEAEDTTPNPYTKATKEKTLDSFFQEVKNLFGEVTTSTIAAHHLSKFNDYIEKTVPLLSSQPVDPDTEVADNPYRRLIDDGALGTVIPNAEDPEAVANYRKAKRENYLSKVR